MNENKILHLRLLALRRIYTMIFNEEPDIGKFLQNDRPCRDKIKEVNEIIDTIIEIYKLTEWVKCRVGSTKTLPKTVEV